VVKSVEGIYRHRKATVMETPADADLNLRERGIEESQAADLRRRLTPFAEE